MDSPQNMLLLQNRYRYRDILGAHLTVPAVLPLPHHTLMLRSQGTLSTVTLTTNAEAYNKDVISHESPLSNLRDSFNTSASKLYLIDDVRVTNVSIHYQCC